MAKRRPGPAKPPPAEPTLTPTALIAQALAAAGLPPRPEGPGVRHYRLNSPEAEEALYDPRKREFGYVPLMMRPVVEWDGGAPATCRVRRRDQPSLSPRARL